MSGIPNPPPAYDPTAPPPPPAGPSTVNITPPMVDPVSTTRRRASPLIPTTDTDDNTLPTVRGVDGRNLPRIVIPEYKISYDPEDYILEVEREFRIYRYDDDTKRMLLGRALKKSDEKVQDWYMTEGIELTEYVELKESFIDAFKATGRTAVRDAKTKWEKCRQGAYDVKTYGATFSKRL
ncbi:hypothetical protein HDV00_002098, partial [Rhizophlyctis rosea]